MLMSSNVGCFSVLLFLKLISECGFVGHRFDEDTPIAETVSGSASEVDVINQLACLNF